MSKMVEVEYELYGRKEKTWYVMCQTKEDLEEVYDRYEFNDENKNASIEWVDRNYKYPILVSPPQDSWARSRLCNCLTEMNDCKKITHEVALPTLCMEVE